MGKFRKQFVAGLIVANPVFMLGLGLCPVLAVSVAIDYGIAMSGAVMFVLMASNVVISLIRKAVPNISRIPIFIVIIATFVTITSLVFEAWIPALHEALGLFLPLVVVNCIILARAEAFASKNPVIYTVADTLGATVGFAMAMITISFFRELLGTGSLSLFGVHLFALPVLGETPILIFILPPGAFLVIGLILALLRWRGVAQSE